MAPIIAIVFSIIEFLVGLRFVFLLLGANPNSPFVNWVYDWSTPLVAPFAGILGQSVTTPVGAVISSVFEPSSLIALIVYGALGSILMRFFGGWRPV